MFTKDRPTVWKHITVHFKQNTTELYCQIAKAQGMHHRDKYTHLRILASYKLEKRIYRRSKGDAGGVGWGVGGGEHSKKTDGLPTQ